MMPELSPTFSKTRELPRSFFISLRAFYSVFWITALTFFFGNGCFALLPSPNFTALSGAAVVRRNIN